MTEAAYLIPTQDTRPLITLRPYQENGIERAKARVRAGCRRLLLVAATGAGKCLGIGTPVLRYDGSIVPVEEVRPGDQLMGPDGQPRTVLSTTRGSSPLYKIIPTRGDPWVCNDVHVLTLVHTTTGAIIDIDLQNYLRESKTFRHCYKQFSPSDGIDFPLGQELPIDPYFLGVWYGDGTKSLNGIAISKPDPEIRDLMYEMAARYHAASMNVRTDGDPCPVHHLITPRGQPNPLLTLMRQVVGDASSVPRAYLTSSRADRAAFLAGFLDSDGYCSHGTYDIAQLRRSYIDGIAFIARSLGFRALISRKTVNDTTYWRASISGDLSWLPLRIPRKRAAVRLQKKAVNRTGFTVESVGFGEYAGFELDRDGRFLLGDFTVTHNTVVAAAIMAGAIAKGKRALFLAHRHEILMQTIAKLEASGVPPEYIGVIQSGNPRRNPGAVIQVASVQTLANRAMPVADLVFIDEAHHAPSSNYCKILDHYANAVHLGLTATPFRLDKKLLKSVFDELILIASPRQLIAQGYLVEPTVFSHPNTPDLSGVKTVAGEFDANELFEKMNKPQILGDLVEHYRTHAMGLRSVAFAINVKHSRNIVDVFNAAGIASAHVDGQTPRAERDAIFARLRAGEILLVSNCMVATEGWDEPSVKGMVMARPTQSVGLWIQMGGRILRPWFEKPEQRAILLDHSGNALRHGLPHEDRHYTLDVPEKTSRGKPRVKTCPECRCVVPGACRVCPECGFEFEFKGTEHVDGDLIEINRDSESSMRRLLREISKMSSTHDKIARLTMGETSRRLKKQFGKSVKERSLQELDATVDVLREWLETAQREAPPVPVQQPVVPTAAPEIMWAEI